MNICTVVLTAGGASATAVIQASLNIVSFSVLAEGSSSSFTMLGTGTVAGFPNVAITFSSGQGYNSPDAPGQRPWNGVTITCTAGTANLVMTTE